MNWRQSAIEPPTTDPTAIVDIFRGAYGTELLCAAVGHLHLAEKLVDGPLSFDQLRGEIGLAERPAHVLFTALLAMGVLQYAPSALTSATGSESHHQRLALSALAREHLLPSGRFFIGDYFSLAGDSPGVNEKLERLKSNRPASTNDEGAAFIYRDGLESAMEREQSARRLTLALAGRAKNVAPALAAGLSLDGDRLLLDVGGGTGIYSIALLQANAGLSAIIWDRPEVLRVAAEMAAEYGVADRFHCVAGDMFDDPVPGGEVAAGQAAHSSLPRSPDLILLSNVLHDWDAPDCARLVERCAHALPPGGRLLIHDVFLNDALDGPLPIALYSAALFSLTEGRAYSAAEYRKWLIAAGLEPIGQWPTLIHCGVIEARKN